ncbi:MAG: 3-hydroxyacyl-CoA dehydrogenase NAD-binding domain-containing protein, partial [Methyloligellaceae bacterium]
MAQKISIIGAGTMGRGIAQVAAQSGFQVLIWDELPQALQSARETIDKNLNREVEKSRLDADQVKSIQNRLQFVSGIEELKQADLIIEAIREDVRIKHALLKELETGLGKDVILLTNTSSLSVTELAQALEHRHRFAGLHFFNPVPSMKLVEIISSLDTSAEVLEKLENFSRQIGKVPIRVPDSPGFLVNHAGRGYGPEALRILADHIARPADIDRIMKDLPGFRMGPFELMDLVGLDVAHPVMEQIYNQFYQDPLYGPNVLAQTQMMAGRLGRKTGRGWYEYRQGKAVFPPEKSFPGKSGASPRVWISPAEP